MKVLSMSLHKSGLHKENKKDVEALHSTSTKSVEHARLKIRQEQPEGRQNQLRSAVNELCGES